MGLNCLIAVFVSQSPNMDNCQQENLIKIDNDTFTYVSSTTFQNKNSNESNEKTNVRNSFFAIFFKLEIKVIWILGFW